MKIEKQERFWSVRHAYRQQGMWGVIYKLFGFNFLLLVEIRDQNYSPFLSLLNLVYQRERSRGPKKKFSEGFQRSRRRAVAALKKSLLEPDDGLHCVRKEKLRRIEGHINAR